MPTTIEALLILSLVVSPGYVFTQIARRVIAHIAEPTDVRFLLTLITAGTAIHGLVFPWTTRVLDYYLAGTLAQHRWETFGWAIATTFVIPLALGILVGRLSLVGWINDLLERIGLGYVDRMPSAWDFVMRQEQPRYLRIHLKDDKGIVAGVFANGSFGSIDPRRADVFLEKAWQVDANGNFDRAIADSRGLWVAHDVIAYVHFLERPEHDDGSEHDDETPESAGSS